MEMTCQEKFAMLCRQLKWKCTSQRLAVYDCIRDNSSHPDVDSVWHCVRSKLPTVTRESVYRILNEFAEHDILWRLDHVASARYDNNTRPHGHFICEKCGTIADFIPGRDIAAFSGEVPGVVRHMEIRLTGLCEKCSAE